MPKVSMPVGRTMAGLMRHFTERGGWWGVPQVLLFLTLGAAWWRWGSRWGLAAVAGGILLVVGGAALAGGGLLALGRHLSPYPAPRHDAALVEGGVYGLARHPIYGGIVLGSLGISLVDGNPAGIGVAAGLGVLLYAKSGFEERRLEEHFPGYAAYRERVRCRLIPWLC